MTPSGHRLGALASGDTTPPWTVGRERSASPVSGISASSRRRVSRLRVIASSRSTRTSPSSRVSRKAFCPVDEPGARRPRATRARDRLAQLHRPTRQALHATRKWSGSRTTRRSTRRSRRCRRTCVARARGVVEASRPERRDPRLVAAPRRVHATARAVELDRGARSPTCPRTCGSATRSRRSRSRTGSSSGSDPTATVTESRNCSAPLAERIEWMGVESAELVKHGVNAFLALSVAFANELASIAERVGADATEVERGLKTESRIGPRAYLRPGAAFAGGTLARDVGYLTQIGEREHVPTQLLRAVRASNDEHKQWAWRTIESLVGGRAVALNGHVIGVWGLVYKQGTDTLRRSSAVELCRELARAGAVVKSSRFGCTCRARRSLRHLHAVRDAARCGGGASASSSRRTGPSYREVEPEHLVAAMRTPIVVDANGFLSRHSGTWPGVRTSESAVDRVTGVLAGRAAIVTGGSHGLGLEIARAYVAAGARVLVCARDAAALDSARAELESSCPDPGSVATATVDVSEPAAVEGLVARCARTLLADRCAREQRGHLRTEGADRGGRLGRVGARGPGESLRLGPVLSRGAAALPGERLRQDHPALRRWRHISAAAPERVRSVEGGGRPLRRDAGRGAARNGDRRQRDRTGRAEHPAPRRGARSRSGARRRRRSTNARSSNSRAGARRSTLRLALRSSSARRRATASPAS